jgi:excisionase family DNA binding protein
LTYEGWEVLLTLRQASERLNCSISGIYALVAQGCLPVVATGASGKGYRVSEEDLNAFIDSRKKGKRPEAWSAKSNPAASQRGNPFVMLDGERLRSAWQKRGVDAH